MKTLLSTLSICIFFSICAFGQGKFPDGTPVPKWFSENKIVSIDTLGTKYIITDYGVSKDSMTIQTQKIQAVIDKASQNGGGVIVIPQGTYLSGALFFKPQTHLYLEEGAVLKGSDDISNFPAVTTRMEGQTLKYFSALINADGLDGFTISGKGTLNGNGERYWRSFWIRRSVIPGSTRVQLSPESGNHWSQLCCAATSMPHAENPAEAASEVIRRGGRFQAKKAISKTAPMTK